MSHDSLTERPESTPADRPDVARRSPVELRSVVVAYEDRPDRRTVYPPGLSGVERMSAWLTADDRAFVDLGGAR